MLRRIDHIGIAVNNLDEATDLFCNVFGLPLQSQTRVDDYQARLATLKIGETEIELLQAESESSPVAKFIAKRGEGIQHICFAVDDIAATLKDLKRHGVQLIDEEPRTVRHGQKIAFLRPQGAHGVLVELVERSE